MRLMVRQKLPEPALRFGFSYVPKTEDFGHHQEHDESAVGIYRDQPLGSSGPNLGFNRLGRFDSQRIHRRIFNAKS